MISRRSLDAVARRRRPDGFASLSPGRLRCEAERDRDRTAARRHLTTQETTGGPRHKPHSGTLSWRERDDASRRDTTPRSRRGSPHYLTASLSFTAIGGATEGTDRYLVYLNHSRSDVLDGLFGGLIRRVIERRLKAEGPAALGVIRRRLESDPPAPDSSSRRNDFAVTAPDRPDRQHLRPGNRGIVIASPHAGERE